jgi:hypothetical protein
MIDGLAQLPVDMPTKESKSWQDFRRKYQECSNEQQILLTKDAGAYDETGPNFEDRACHEREGIEEGGLGVRTCD